MSDHLAVLAAKAKARVQRGYYDNHEAANLSMRSLVREIQDQRRRTPIITEIKYASPSAGRIRETINPLDVARSMLRGGACGISILTDPEDFDGSLSTLANVSRETEAPTVMKDIVVSPRQLEAGRRAGASAVVLISELFSRKLADTGLETMIYQANRLGLEVLLEANSQREFENLERFSPDLYGINNRDLSTFRVDLSTTEKIMAANANMNRFVVSESGIESPEDIRRLRAAGARAFLVGTAIMKSSDIEEKVRGMVNA